MEKSILLWKYHLVITPHLPERGEELPNRIDLLKMRRAYLEGFSRRKESGNGKVTLRATAKLVKDAFLQGRIGSFHFECDEPPSRDGDDKAPSPLEYFLIGAAF